MFILYKTTNTINNKFYIGVHKQRKGFGPYDFDGYFGSGIVLKEAIKKYGTKVFIRETLACSYNKDEIYQLEKNTVDVNNSATYNIKEGGFGGFEYINDNNLGTKTISNKTMELRKQTLINKYGVDNSGKLELSIEKLIARNKLPKSIETINKQSKSLKSSEKVKGENNPMFGKTGKLSPCYGRTGEKHPMFGKLHPMRGKKQERIRCPYCDKDGTSKLMLKTHFDNCKDKK